MPIMDYPPVKPTPRTGTQGTLRLTREEVRVLHYYRALSNEDREAVRCLLNALLVPQPQLAGHTATSARPSATGDARARSKSGQRAAATVRL